MIFLFNALLMPPGLIIVGALVAVLLSWHRPRAARWIAVAAFLGLYGLSIPLTTDILMARLQRFPPLATLEQGPSAPEAIVILSADQDMGPEYGGPTVGAMTLVRVRYGARLQRQTGLPVLVTGGVFPPGGISLADEMRQTLMADYGLSDVWVEGRSQTTMENARFSAALLKAKGIRRVYLVTHAWHMARAAKAFIRAGLEIVPAPTGFVQRDQINGLDFLPSAKAQLLTFYALHEMVGGLAYDAQSP